MEVTNYLMELGASKIIRNHEGFIPLITTKFVQSREIVCLFIGKANIKDSLPHTKECSWNPS
jgi:hypothetical protein